MTTIEQFAERMIEGFESRDEYVVDILGRVTISYDFLKEMITDSIEADREHVGHLIEQAGEALAFLADADAQYQEAGKHDRYGEPSVKEYENWEDAQLSFAQDAEHILRQLTGEES